MLKVDQLPSIFLQGSLFYSIRQIIITVVNLATTIFLTRLLLPSDFGYISLVTIVISVISILSDGGLGVYLIQRKEEVSDDDISDITNFQLVIWISIFLVLFLIWLFPISDKISNIGILYLLVSSISIPFSIFKAASIIKLERGLVFNRIALIESLEQITYSIIAISLGYFGFGVWAIVFALVSKAVFSFLLSYVLSPIKFNFFSTLKLRELKKAILIGLSYQIPSIFETLRSLLNPVVIGLTLGMNYSGFTDRGILIASIPTTFLGTVWQKILFPLVARIQGEKKMLSSVYENSLYIHSILDKAIYLPFFLHGKEIISYFIGDKWLPIYPFILIFACGNILFSSYTTTTIAFFKGLGFADVMAKWSLFQFPLAIIFISIFTFFYGFYGFALGSQVLWCGIFYFNKYLNKTLKVSFLRSIIVPLISFLVSYVVFNFALDLYNFNLLVLIFFELLFYLIIIFLLDFAKIRLIVKNYKFQYNSYNEE
ncbi:oligosaccharide flippase family protein [Aquirufa sp. 2-AUSEE-184A6]|uniref:Oligosaccharide flippase family protein n=1 Tax=Aquirufa novilacunae TaxID=3139305 RepID=A0ABW8SV31_9BACT